MLDCNRKAGIAIQETDDVMEKIEEEAAELGVKVNHYEEKGHDILQCWKRTCVGSVGIELVYDDIENFEEGDIRNTNPRKVRVGSKFPRKTMSDCRSVDFSREFETSTYDPLTEKTYIL